MPPSPIPDDEPAHDDDAPLADALRASRELHDAPASVVQAAAGLWRSRTPQPPATSRSRITADRIDEPHDAGATPHLACRAEGLEVVLHAAASAGADHWRVEGRVTGSRAVASVELRCGGFAAMVVPDARGTFRFDDVPADTCRLLLVSGDTEVVLPDWVLGARG